MNISRKTDHKDPRLERIANTLHSVHWVWEFDPVRSPPLRLFDFLEEKLPQRSRLSSWEQRAEFGGLYLNGRRATGDRDLSVPTKIEYYEPKYPIHEAAQFFPPFSEKNILWHDKKIAVIFKPEGLPSLPNREQIHYNVRHSLERLFGHAVHMPSRLDAATAGIVVVSIDPTMHGPLQRLFERREIEKRYRLLVTGKPEWSEKRVETKIGHDPLHPILRKVAPTGVQAVTDFSVIGSNRHHTLIEAKPHTGRTHQIRIHAAHCGFPIVGDNFYQGEPSERLHLLSSEVSFLHPTTLTRMSFSLPDEIRPHWERFPDRENP